MGSHSPDHTARAWSRAWSALAPFLIWANALLGRAEWEGLVAGARIMPYPVPEAAYHPPIAPLLTSIGSPNITMSHQPPATCSSS